MDHSLSDRSITHSIKPQRLGLRHTFVTWLLARADGPKHKKGSLPLGTLEPVIARIEQWVKKRNDRLAAISVHYWHWIPATVKQSEMALKRPEAELATRRRALDYVIERYKADHDGLEPPEHGAQFSQLASFWVLGAVFSIGELPLMSAALERLPLPDWARFVATISASAIVIYMSHEIGIWFAKPAKTLAQTVFGWVLVAVLCIILTFAAIVRRDSLREHQRSPAAPTPEVFIRQSEGGRQFYA